MSKLWTGITAGLLAGAAGASAKNAVSYLDQAVSGDAPPSAPAAPTVQDTASTVSTVTVQHFDRSRSAALGPLGGLLIGAGVGAAAGAVRGSNATPNPVLAAVITGLAAMGLGDGIAAATGHAGSFSVTNVSRDLLSHLAYGAVTGYALHRILDPHTSRVSRISGLDRIL